MNTRRSALALFAAAAAVCGGVGCSSKLETGYVPRALGSTAAERKGYYASPFTAEAAAAQQGQSDDQRALRRPGPSAFR